MTSDKLHPHLPSDSLKGVRVLVAMSGGVDSSVAAWLLQRAGASVIGVTFRNFCFSTDSDVPARSCCSLSALSDARQVCHQLQMDFQVVDETERFQTEVIDDCVSEYAAGRTPNPCVRCNAAVRFPRLLEEASAAGFDFVATGHYARIVASDDGTLALARGYDTRKDQSYFLAAMDPAFYDRVIFPLGGLDKPTVRDLAADGGLHIAEKEESQDLCFLAGRSLAEFLAERDLLRGGRILGPGGEALGEHAGAALFTPGQRHGLGVSGAHLAGGRPLYVTSVNAESGDVQLGTEDGLLTRSVCAEPAWLRSSSGMSVQIRYRGPAVNIRRAELDGARLSVELEEAVKAPAPGQSLVVYAGDRVAGWGLIKAESP